ncbi:MAG: galactokinase family protein [Spirochaetaceae bacterium]
MERSAVASVLMDQLAESYKRKFGSVPTRAVRSPLRICPLGAHVDHQDGIVSGMALTDSVDLVYSTEEDGYLRVQSLDFPDEEYFHVDQVPDMVPTFWGNYLRGAVRSLSRSYKLHRGIRGVVRGKLPIGGLSSSAAVTTAYLMALCDVNEIELEPRDLIDYSHWVETDFIGLNNGILDQSANILSRDGHLMVMDCRTEEFEMVPRSSEMPEFDVVIVYSGISTTLIKTDYNNRVDECKVAAWLLQELGGLPVSPFREVQLRDIPREVYREQADALPGRFRRRADHYFGEIERVNAGVEAWRRGDIEELGRQIFASGRSSIEKYESGCPELITIYETLAESEGVYGARFSGAGYRGCCIGLVDPAYRESIAARIDAVYPREHPEFKDHYRVFFSRTDDGARVLQL